MVEQGLVFDTEQCILLEFGDGFEQAGLKVTTLRKHYGRRLELDFIFNSTSGMTGSTW